MNFVWLVFMNYKTETLPSKKILHMWLSKRTGLSVLNNVDDEFEQQKYFNILTSGTMKKIQASMTSLLEHTDFYKISISETMHIFLQLDSYVAGMP